MTITSTPSKISYAGDGVSTVFPLPFTFDTATDLKVVETDSNGNPVEVTTGFSITGGSGSTGTLTRVSALPSGTTLTIYDDPEITQIADYLDNDAFPAETHERALDRCVRISKRLIQLLQNCVRVDDGDPGSGTGTLLSSVQARKGKYLFFNAVTGAIEYATAVIGATLSQSIIGQFLFPQASTEASSGLTPSNYASSRGYSARYGEPDEAAFASNFGAMYALKPWTGAPACHGGFVVNAPYGRICLGTNWTSAAGVHRQMYQTGYATMIQGDEVGNITFYTNQTSTPAGNTWEAKYTLVLLANGTQWVNSNGAGQSWSQQIYTEAVTPNQGYGTSRMLWGVAATASNLMTGAAVGDACWVNQTPGAGFQWSADGGASFCLQIKASNFYVNAAVGATSASWEYRIGNSTKGYVGFSGSSGGIISGSADGDAVIRSSTGFRVSTNNGTSSAIVADNAGAIYVPLVGTTASAANAFLDNASSNKILRSTSSLRYKAEVQPLAGDVADRVLRMTPIRFRSRCEADNPEWSYYGLAAEEVAAIDPRYAFFDSEGRPDGVQYDRLVVPLLHIVQRQNARIAALEAIVVQRG